MTNWMLNVVTPIEHLEKIINLHAISGTPLIFSFGGCKMNPGDKLEILAPENHPYFGTVMSVIRFISVEQYISIFGFKPNHLITDDEWYLYEVEVD